MYRVTIWPMERGFTIKGGMKIIKIFIIGIKVETRINIFVIRLSSVCHISYIISKPLHIKLSLKVLHFYKYFLTPYKCCIIFSSRNDKKSVENFLHKKVGRNLPQGEKTGIFCHPCLPYKDEKGNMNKDIDI